MSTYPGIHLAVASTELQKSCLVCTKGFSSYWNDKEKTWKYQNALRVDLQPLLFEIRSSAHASAPASEQAAKAATMASLQKFDAQILHYTCYQSITQPSTS